ncbi:MAG TPA: NAD(P)H-dependent oxidoreductase subunit E, partial [Actinomycetota bacterium]|nr:NAD(P)H-dependent oxidoreductase subunit E [Actinomycetota bacterium]
LLFHGEEEECMGACDKAPVLAVNYLFYDKVTEGQLEQMIESIRAGQVPEASRGGVPGELKEVSLTLAGIHSLRPAVEPVPAEAKVPPDGSAQGPMGEGPARPQHAPPSQGSSGG